jgi:hypothetical protein
MLKVTVIKGIAKPISWGANETRKAGSMRVQECYLHTVEEDGTPSFAPVKIEIVLNRAKVNAETGEVLAPEQSPYAPGEYQLHPSSVYVDRAGRPAFTPRLTPVKRAA